MAILKQVLMCYICLFLSLSLQMTDASDSENDDPNAESTRLNESHSSNSNDGMGHTQRSVLEAGNMPPPNKKLKVQMSFNKNRS